MNQTPVVVVKFDGELEFSRREELREKFLSAANALSVLLDFSGVTYADSTALAALIAFQKASRKRAARIAMVVVLPQFDRLLRYAGLHDAFAVFPDRGAALTYLAEQKAQ